MTEQSLFREKNKIPSPNSFSKYQSQTKTPPEFEGTPFLTNFNGSSPLNTSPRSRTPALPAWEDQSRKEKVLRNLFELREMKNMYKWRVPNESAYPKMESMSRNVISTCFVCDPSVPSSGSSKTQQFNQHRRQIFLQLSSDLEQLYNHYENGISQSEFKQIADLLQLYLNDFKKLQNKQKSKDQTKLNHVHDLKKIQDRLNSQERIKKTPEETKVHQSKKLLKAQQNREQLEMEKVGKARQTVYRIKEVNERRSQKIAQVEHQMNEKQGKADQNHDAFIQSVKKKAGSENTKVDEIAFITKLTNETKKYIYIKKLEDSQVRRQELLEERKRKIEEENIAKEKNAQERRRALEIQKKERQGNKRRIKLFCKYCSVELPTGDFLENHLHGKKHRLALEKAGATNVEPHDCLVTVVPPGSDAVLKIDEESLQKKILELKKQTKLAKQRMATRALEYSDNTPTKESPHKGRINKLLQDLKNPQQSKNYEYIEKNLNDLLKLLTPKNTSFETDQHIIRQLCGFDILIKLLSNESLPSNIIHLIIKVLLQACRQNSANCSYLLMGNKLIPLVSLLDKSLFSKAEYISSICSLLALHISQPCDNENFLNMKIDLISYIIDSCIIDKIEIIFQQLHSSQEIVSPFVEKCFELLETITSFSQTLNDPSLSSFSSLVATIFKETYFGIITLLISLLLQDGPKKGFKLSSDAMYIVIVAIKILNDVALLDIPMFQESLGSAENKLPFFHLVYQLLTFCTSPETEFGGEKGNQLLNELILLIGLFTLQNHKNQEVVQWGKSPAILQQLCTLQFVYFSDAKHKFILFPTLLSACFGNLANKSILEQELGSDTLVAWLQEEAPSEKELKIPSRLSLCYRFPSSLKEEAVNFFSNSTINC